MQRATTQDARVELGPYGMQDLLGEGATGIVYRVVDPMGRVLALKVLRQELALSERERSRFLAEADVLRRVRHTALVEVVDAGVFPNGQSYIAMPFLDGCSLAERLQRGPMRFDVALHLFEQLADALHTLHHAGLVHRDIKPENIFVVSGDARAILLDLGIARDVNASPSTTTHAGLIRGTPAYMAPERFFGSPATPATDIYELGVVLYLTLVGALPWTRFDDPTERMRPAPPTSRGVVLPPRLSSTLMRALAVSPGERPASAQDFASAVLDALSPESVQQIANQATSFVNRSAPPTAYAMTAMAPSAVSGFAPTGSAMPATARPATPRMEMTPRSSGTGPAAVSQQAPPQSGYAPRPDGAPPFPSASFGAQPQAPGAPYAAPPASGPMPPKRKTPVLFVAAMTGASLLGSGALAAVLFVRSAPSTHADRLASEPAATSVPAATPAQASAPPVVQPPAPHQAEPEEGRAKPLKPARPSRSGPTTPATPTASASANGARGGPGDDEKVGKDVFASGANPKAAVTPPPLPMPPEHEFPSEKMPNCTKLHVYACMAAVKQRLPGKCQEVKMRMDTAERATNPNLKRATDGACSGELQSLRTQAQKEEAAAK